MSDFLSDPFSRISSFILFGEQATLSRTEFGKHWDLVVAISANSHIMRFLSEDHFRDYSSYLYLVQIRRETGRLDSLLFECPTLNNPIFVEWTRAERLIVGSFQTVYGLEWPSLRKDFEVSAPEGPEIRQLMILTEGPEGFDTSRAGLRESLLVSAEHVLRSVNVDGQVQWAACLPDPFVVSAAHGEIVCTEIPSGGWRWYLDPKSGRVLQKTLRARSGPGYILRP